MKSMVFTILFFISSLSYSQDLLTLYQKNLPAEYYIKQEDKEFLLVNLTKLVSIQPDLVYYFSEILGNFSESHDTSSFRMSMGFLTALGNNIECDRVVWLRSQINEVRLLNLEPSLKQKAIDYFTPALSDTLTPVILPEYHLPVDSNKKYYFAFIYYINNSTLDYNPSINYRLKAIDAEKQIVDYYKDSLNASLPNSIIYIYDHSINGILKYWSLFKNKEVIAEKDEEAFKIVLDFLYNKYSYDGEFLKTTISGGYGLNNTAHISYLINEDPFHDPIEHKNSTSINQYSIDISYKYQIKPVRSMLSYIGLDFSFQSFGIPDNIKENINNTIRYTIFTPIDTTNYIDEITSNGANIKINKITTLILEPSIPIYFPYKNISIEFGGYIGINLIKYSLNYAYHYKRTELRSNGNGTSTLFVTQEGNINPPEENKTQINWIVLPIANIIYEPISHLVFKAVLAPDLSKIIVGFSI